MNRFIRRSPCFATKQYQLSNPVRITSPCNHISATHRTRDCPSPLFPFWIGVAGLSTRPGKNFPRQSLGSNLHENIYTIPNALTLSRLVIAPVVGYHILQDNYVMAFGLFAYAGLTDLVDGYLARRWKQQSVLGSILDPTADKTLMTISAVTLATKGALPCMSLT
jgi:hypothetical protein